MTQHGACLAHGFDGKVGVTSGTIPILKKLDDQTSSVVPIATQKIDQKSVTSTWKLFSPQFLDVKNQTTQEESLAGLLWDFPKQNSLGRWCFFSAHDHLTQIERTCGSQNCNQPLYKGYPPGN